MTIKVTFVCLGNICRSPMAEGVFKDKVEKAGLSAQFEIDSCGTGRWHIGESAHPGTQKILKQHDIDYRGAARQINENDLAEADYLIAMSQTNEQAIQRLGSVQGEVSLLLDYARGVDETDVPDPYYTGNFEYVYDLVEAGTEGLLMEIRAKHGL